MSELSNLHHRIVAELSASRPPTPCGPLSADGTVCEDDDLLDDADAPEEAAVPADRLTVLRPALAGAGLLASAAMLGTGFEAGHALLPMALTVAGIAGTLLILADWRRALRPKAAMRERAVDRSWEDRESAHAISAIHDALGDVAILRDGNGVIVEANETFRRLTGWLKPEGQRCEALGLDVRPAGACGHYAVEIATVDGPLMFDWHDMPTRCPRQGTLQTVSIGRDVTAQTKAARDSAQALLRAEAESRAKSHLLATVSHEIRTPLSGMLGMNDLLAQTPLSAQQANYLAGMRQSGHDLVQLVGDLLDCASMEAGRFALRPAPAPLRPLVESVVEMLSHRAHGKGIEIASTVSVDVPETLEIDGPRLKQVLFNVVGNAVKFTATGGVLVSAAEDRGALVLRVTDTGPGLTEAEQARIFDAFEQAGDTAQRAGGTGLGLAISRRIVAAFGGDITVTSRLGKGSVFEIRFPMRTGNAHHGAVRARILSGSGVLLLAPQGPASDALAATIETLGGRCHFASTPEEAGRILTIARERAASGAGAMLTDIIVDHRHAAAFRLLSDDMPALDALRLRKTYLVNPEERDEKLLHQTDGFHAWLIRPLRERSLIEVLKGRMKGIEPRDAINDNRPVLRDEPAAFGEATGGVLLGEDDPVNATILRTVLERSGHSVRLVSDFDAMTQALSTADRPPAAAPSILITDLNMPGGDGLTMLRRLRRMEEASVGRGHMPVVVQTADTRDETRRDLMAAGADAVIAKPADPKALIDTVTRLLAG